MGLYSCLTFFSSDFFYTILHFYHSGISPPSSGCSISLKIGIDWVRIPIGKLVVNAGIPLSLIGQTYLLCKQVESRTGLGKSLVFMAI